MVDVVDVAEAVAEFLSPEGAVMEFAPEYDLGDLDERKVVVVPYGTQYRNLSRSHVETVYTVQVGVLKRCTEDDVKDLVAYVMKLGRSFHRLNLAGTTCSEVKYVPIFDAAHLRERRQFTSVIQLVFKTVESE